MCVVSVRARSVFHMVSCSDRRTKLNDMIRYDIDVNMTTGQQTAPARLSSGSFCPHPISWPVFWPVIWPAFWTGGSDIYED